LKGTRRTPRWLPTPAESLFFHEEGGLYPYSTPVGQCHETAAIWSVPLCFGTMKAQLRAVSRETTSTMQKPRFILHIDLDAFYASIEQRDHPNLRGKPVIVGGSPDRRGVVSTASYEARRFGVHSAMPSRTAKRLCPEAIFLPPRFEVYRTVSQQVMAIFKEHTELVEPLSMDEAYLDVTAAVHELDEAEQLAREIKQQIRSNLMASQ
jgi:impB/mucB/samB family